MDKIIILNKADNVAVALTDLNANELIIVNNDRIEVINLVKKGHKIALKNIKKGQEVIKYGKPIGVAVCDILQGSFVHSHNLKSKASRNLSYCYNFEDTENRFSKRDIEINGYVRSDGQTGIRNEIWIIPMVGCVNSVCRLLAEEAKAKLSNSNIDDIVCFPHQFGCSQTDEDLTNFQNMLAGLARNPNAAGVLMVGLGCENNTAQSFKELLGDYDKDRIKFLICQEVEDEKAEGMKILTTLAERASKDKRQKVSLACLKIGLKCGGSDSFSGITVNPIMGEFSDMLISMGGSAVLTEIPEMYGAESCLLNRCVNINTYNDLCKVFSDYEKYYSSHNQPIYLNPSPGNKDGGITTLEEKSLGCILKGGNTHIMQVKDYCQSISGNGLMISASPGNDMVACTSLAACGCQLILFSTGRGTPFASVVPTLKLSSNSRLAQFKKGWIDFDGGKVLSEEIAVNQAAEELMELVAKTANGQKCKSELNGSKEIAFFKKGVIL